MELRNYNISFINWVFTVSRYSYILIFRYDDDNEKEIHRQTLYEPVPYPSSLWKKLSSESRHFVNGNIKVFFT